MAGNSSQFKTFQTPSNYEDAIQRHAQYVRWYSALTCFCVDDMGRPDPNCNICYGKGSIYYPLIFKRVVEKTFVKSNTIVTTTENIRNINKLVRLNNDTISYSTFNNKEITLSSPAYNYSILWVDYIADLRRDYTGSGTYLGNGLIRVNVPSISVLYGDFKGEVTEVINVHDDTKDIDLNVVSFWEDMILTDSSVDSGDVISVTCKYIEPERFLIVGITPKQKVEAKDIPTEEINLTATFYGLLPVGAGDLISLLTAEQKTSVVGNLNSGETTFTLPNFHVASILRVQDSNGVIDDVTIIQNNKLKFNSTVPVDKFSVAYTYNPAFVVLDDLPSLRYAEDKIFPKRVTLKRYDVLNRRDDRPLGRVDY